MHFVISVYIDYYYPLTMVYNLFINGDAHLIDTMEKARTLWPAEIKNLPMNEAHKNKLKDHWNKLHADFQIK